MFFIVESFDHHFLTNRKATKPDIYQARSGWSEKLDEAKVFSTQAAATRSANENGERGYWVLEAFLSLGDVVKTVGIEHD